MSSFVAMSACRGQRPSGLVSRYQYERPRLLGRLLRDRHVARFLVAPDGYGKTSLAFAYADMVFSFNRVSWINCKSPCFIRDLDSGALLDGFKELKSKPYLVVFDDIPLLSIDRAAVFSSVVDTLLELGCEVVVTCVPSCDMFAGLHRDRILVDASDLVLDDMEIGLGVAGVRVGRDVLAGFTSADHVACLRWKESGCASFAACIASEELPADVTVAMIAMLILQRGELDDLRVFLPLQGSSDAVSFLAAHYPHLGIDLQGGVFEAAFMSIEAMSAALLPLINRVAGMTCFGGRDAMMTRFADALIAHASCERAAAVLLHLVSRSGCAAWLTKRGWSLLAEGAVGSTWRLCEHVLKDTTATYPEVCALAAWSALILDDRDAAFTYARRVAFGRSSQDPERVIACLLLAHGEDGELQERARDALGVLVAAYEAGSLADCPQDADASSSIDVRAWMGFSRVALGCHRSIEEGLQAWLALFAAEGKPYAGLLPLKCPRNVQAELVLMASATYVLARAGKVSVDALRQKRTKSGDVLNGYDAVRVAAEFLRARVEEAASSHLGMGWFDVEAAHVLENLSEAGCVMLDKPLSMRALGRIRQVEVDLFVQRTSAAKTRAERERRTREYCETHPDPFRNEARVLRGGHGEVLSASPILRVNLFGNFEAKIGEKEVGESLRRSRKARLMLALLVINRGQGITRERLSHILWPSSTPKAAKKNFYGVWMQLKRALSVEGSCPYLIREENNCRIEAHLLSSDIIDFDELCRLLLVGKSNEWEWETLAFEIGESYSSDLMPGEEGNEELCMERSRCRLQLIDALVFASSRLLGEGKNQGALWLAREAWHRDPLREDACMALMQAQVASGQRGSAIDTFFVLKKRLADDLGIDPSSEIMALYADILSADLVPA